MNPLECVSMSNQECKGRPKVVNVNSDEPVFYLFSIKKSKYSGSSNNISSFNAKLGVTDVVNNSSMNVFNVMSRTNETRYIKWLETCKCKCRLDGSIYNSKQLWSINKC